MPLLLIGFIALIIICLISLIIGINEQDEKCMFIALVSFIFAIFLAFIGHRMESANPKSISQRYDELTASETLVSNNETHEINETSADTVHDEKSIVLKSGLYSLYKISNEPFYTLKLNADVLTHFRKCRNCHGLKRIQHVLNEHNVNALHIIHDHGSMRIKSSRIIQINNHIQ